MTYVCIVLCINLVLSRHIEFTSDLNLGIYISMREACSVARGAFAVASYFAQSRCFLYFNDVKVNPIISLVLKAEAALPLPTTDLCCQESMIHNLTGLAYCTAQD